MAVKVKTQREWEVDDFGLISELLTGNEQEPVVFGLKFRVNPMTRAQLVALRDAFNEVLQDVPERRIMTLADLGR